MNNLEDAEYPVYIPNASPGEVIETINKYAKTWSKEDTDDYILKNLLPAYTHDGNLEVVKTVLEHYDLDFLEAGEMDYVGNGESADPGDFVFDNLLRIAASEGHHDMVRYFVKDLIRRNVDPEPYVNNADVHHIVGNILRQENKKRAFLMRRKLPNNIALHTIPKYLSSNVFTANNIRGLQSENVNTNKYFGNKKGSGKTRQRRSRKALHRKTRRRNQRR